MMRWVKQPGQRKPCRYAHLGLSRGNPRARAHTSCVNAPRATSKFSQFYWCVIDQSYLWRHQRSRCSTRNIYLRKKNCMCLIATHLELCEAIVIENTSRSSINIRVRVFRLYGESEVSHQRLQKNQKLSQHTFPCSFKTSGATWKVL